MPREDGGVGGGYRNCPGLAPTPDGERGTRGALRGRRRLLLLLSGRRHRAAGWFPALRIISLQNGEPRSLGIARGRAKTFEIPKRMRQSGWKDRFGCRRGWTECQPSPGTHLRASLRPGRRISNRRQRLGPGPLPGLGAEGGPPAWRGRRRGAVLSPDLWLLPGHSFHPWREKGVSGAALLPPSVPQSRGSPTSPRSARPQRVRGGVRLGFKPRPL